MWIETIGPHQHVPIGRKESIRLSGHDANGAVELAVSLFTHRTGVAGAPGSGRTPFVRLVERTVSTARWSHVSPGEQYGG